MGKELQVPCFTQLQSRWCWAASAEMVLEYLQTAQPHEQCDIAQRQLQFKRDDCCKDPESANKGIKQSEIAPLYTQFGVQTKKVLGPLTYPDIKAEIDANRPVEVGLQFTGGGYHAVVIRGYLDDADKNLLVNDPIEEWQWGVVTLDDLNNFYGFGKWVVTWTLQ